MPSLLAEQSERSRRRRRRRCYAQASVSSTDLLRVFPATSNAAGHPSLNENLLHPLVPLHYAEEALHLAVLIAESWASTSTYRFKTLSNLRFSRRHDALQVVSEVLVDAIHQQRRIPQLPDEVSPDSAKARGRDQTAQSLRKKAPSKAITGPSRVTSLLYQEGLSPSGSFYQSCLRESRRSSQQREVIRGSSPSHGIYHVRKCSIPTHAFRHILMM